MKNKNIVIVGILSLLMIIPSAQARKMNKTWSTVLGFAGGMIVGSALSQQQHQTVYYEQYPVYVDRHVYVQQAPVYIERPTGHWETRYRRTWIQGYWIQTLDNWNRPIRRWVSGYYISEPYQVWVPYY